MDNHIFGVATKAAIFKNNKYLILFKSDQEEINPQSYDLPGGRLEFGEKPEKTVIRETKEETGLTVKPISIINSWTFTKENFQLVGVDFLCEYLEGTEKISEEHSDFKWISVKEIEADNNLPKWIKKTIKKAEKFLTLYTVRGDNKGTVTDGM